MQLPLYKIVPEVDSFRICLVFQGQDLPLPNELFTQEEVAKMRIQVMQKQDFELMQREGV